MMIATRLSDFDRAQDPQVFSEDQGLRAELGHAVMKRLRRAAILLLDMRTEFEILTPGEVSARVPRGLMADLGLAIARQARRAASKSLDLWTEFTSLDWVSEGCRKERGASVRIGHR